MDVGISFVDRRCQAEDGELQGLEEPSAVEDEEVDFGDAAEEFDPEAKPEDVQEKFRDAFRKMGYTILLSGLCDMSLVDYVSWPSFFEDMASSVLQACSRFGEVLHCFPDCGGVHARVWVRFATEQAAEAEGYMATATLAPPQSEEDHDQAAPLASGPGACIAGTSAAAPSTAAKGRRKVFDAHLDQDTIEAGLATGALIRGILRVSGSKLSIAFVRPEGARSDDRDLVVRGSQHRNRAVHGDVVIVQPIMYGRQEESSSEEEAPPAAIPCSDSEEEEIVLNKPHLAGAARAAPKSSEQEVQMAKVVAIAEKKGQGRVIVCTLHPDRDKKALCARRVSQSASSSSFLCAVA
ncbi:dis3l [Symbiodinium sp. KB8]|nr:dis3l [Symbiodinium sp. KB8]